MILKIDMVLQFTVPMGIFALNDQTDMKIYMYIQTLTKLM